MGYWERFWHRTSGDRWTLPKLFRSPFALVLMTAMTACTNPGPMQIPQSKYDSPLAQIAPLTFAIRMTNSTGASFVTIGKVPIGDKPVTTFISEALRAELERSGHRVLRQEASEKYDILVDIDVKQASIIFTPHTRAGIVIVKFILTGQVGVRQILSKTYEGTHYDRLMSYPMHKVLPVVFNEALLNLIEDFTADPDLISGLQQVAQSR